MLEFHLKRSGMLIVVSAPSGGGKSTILRTLLKEDATLSYSISATTRRAREGEVEGRDYYFMNVEEFKRLIDEDAFFEWAIVHGNYYGTLKREVEAKIADGRDVILDIDVQGSLALKQDYPDSVLIFVLPPSIATLERRLRARGLDDEATMQVRLNNARSELRRSPEYDFVIVNRKLDDTIRSIRTIIDAERHRSTRLTLRDALGEVLMAATASGGADDGE